MPDAPIRPRAGERDHHVVLFGATGFTGRLVARHLAEAAPGDVRIALAGRSAQKLEAVRAQLPGAAASWPVLVADVGDPASLAAVAGATDVVATTVGPYARHGLPVVAACAAAGTDYADLTGEVLFMRRAIDAHHQEAVRTGARIVHACGFDSIPSDLGVHVLHRAAAAGGQGALAEVTYALVDARGGFSGGTVHSLLGQVDEAAGDPALAALVADPYALSPDRSAEPDLGDERDLRSVRRGPDGTWEAPFVMAGINTRVVRRSNALAGYPYGRSFRYREVMAFRGPTAPAIATAVAGGSAAAMGALALAPTRRLASRFLPAPGSGPSEAAQAAGRFRVELRAATADGRQLRGVVAADGDPGYRATAVMLGQAALALALDRDQAPIPAGVLTPATAMGDALVDRLRAQGFTLEAGPA